MTAGEIITIEPSGIVYPSYSKVSAAVRAMVNATGCKRSVSCSAIEVFELSDVLEREFVDVHRVQHALRFADDPLELARMLEQIDDRPADGPVVVS